MFYIPRTKFTRLLVLLLGLSLVSMLGLMLIRTSSGDELNAFQEKASTPIRVDYMGTVPQNNSLTKLIPKEDNLLLRLKEKWLDSETNLDASPRRIYSENGKYSIVCTSLEETQMEGLTEAAFEDSNGTRIWHAIIADGIYVSNNGRNIATVNLFSPEEIFFYDVRASTQPICTSSVHGIDAFSYNGEYFISAGSKLILRKADGSLIWQKDTGTDILKAVAISADGSFIVMATNGGVEPNITEAKNREEEEQLNAYDTPGMTDEEKQRRSECLKKQFLGLEDTKTSQNPALPKKEKVVYLSFLKGDGTLINQTEVSLRSAQNLAMSYDGRYAVVACDSTVLLYQVESGTLIWRYSFPNIYWWIRSIALSRDGSIIALGMRPNRADFHSPPYLCILKRDGSKIVSFQLEDSFLTSRYPLGPKVEFTEDNQYILMGTDTQKYLFKITEVTR